MKGRRSNLETIFLGTILVHVALLTLLDIGGTWARRHPPEQPPEQIELDDTPPPPPPPKLPEIKPPTPPPPVKQPDTPPPPVAHHVAVHEVEHTQPPTHEPPPEQPPPALPPDHTPTGGGDEAYRLPEGPTGGVAIPVAHGHGPGGTGGGTDGGRGAGPGTGTAPPAPVSIAAIKKKAMPRGDYSYFDAGKDYPAEAKQQGVEGTIRVRLVVDANGKVTQRTLLNRLGHGLDELALERAGEIQFDPALDDHDHPVTSLVVWTFTFTLPK